MKQEIVKINFQEPLTPRLEAESISESIPYSASVLSEIPVIELFMSRVTGYRREQMPVFLNKCFKL